MKIKVTCGCGLEAYNWGDLTAHWIMGVKTKPEYLRGRHYLKCLKPFLAKHPKIRAIYTFLFTKIEVIRG